jgi:hypothetical protein
MPLVDFRGRRHLAGCRIVGFLLELPSLLFRGQFFGVCHDLLLRLGLVSLRFAVWSCDLDSGGFADVGTEPLGERCRVVRVDSRVFGRARYGHISKARIDEFGVRRGVHVDQDSIRGKSLRAVRRNGVAVVEVAHLGCVECESPGLVAIHADSHVGAVDAFQGAQIAVLDVHFGLADGELEPVAFGKVSGDFPVRGDAMQSLGIVGDVLAVLPFDRELVRFGVCRDDSSVGAALKAKFLAPSGVVENVGGLVERGPVAVGAGQLRTLGKNGQQERTAPVQSKP